MSENILPFVEVNPKRPHDAVVIWLHGLGDSGNGFAPIVPELKLPDSLAIRFVFPHAPMRAITINNGMSMRAWYDIKTLDFNHRADVEGVKDSAKQVVELIEHEIAKGIPSERIVLAGFSQGGVIALDIAARYTKKLAGVLALSTYMSEPEKLAKEAVDINKDTPFLCAHGQQDEMVPMFLGHAAYKVLEQNGFAVEWKDYLMQHNVCAQELQDISAWLQKTLK
ncbi:dienelactone hydrolase family protein [Aliiglaciecola sp. LCG003]|uniref:alpha/beta hydrolase n=1 Tax=Aliiglaciecola sp. LCG003 TaxID=3053655 RepID=UPI0025735563|nr:dienelactone hydrolase family protein [Aliiglaciecola sp. LCG003]WJG09578.1 dienelactone hydrolase family protein [Aliiglaciecola sp. LCG003]